MHPILVRIIVIGLHALHLGRPLLTKNRRQHLPFVLKSGALLLLSNWSTIKQFIDMQKSEGSLLRRLFNRKREM